MHSVKRPMSPSSWICRDMRQIVTNRTHFVSKKNKRGHFVDAPSQWETTLHCNAVPLAWEQTQNDPSIIWIYSIFGLWAGKAFMDPNPFHKILQILMGNHTRFTVILEILNILIWNLFPKEIRQKHYRLFMKPLICFSWSTIVLKVKVVAI